MGKNPLPNGNFRLLPIFFSHGLTAALTVYLAVKGGNWIDERFGTSPLFVIVLVLLVVGANLSLLIKEMIAEADKGDRDRRAGGSAKNREGEER